jgi:hypothetical protein
MQPANRDCFASTPCFEQQPSGTSKNVHAFMLSPFIFESCYREDFANNFLYQFGANRRESTLLAMP